MTIRYNREIRVRFKGDPDTSKRYISRARFFVGQLAENNALSHASRKVVDADGVVYRVIMDGGVPIVEIDARAARVDERPADDALQGFAVTTRDGDIGEVIATFQTPFDGYDPLFEDADARTAAGVIGDLWGPLYPNGIEKCGNIDWHGNGDLALSFCGSPTRYFPIGVSLKRLVYAEGRILFDGSTFDSDGDERTGWTVYGAGLRRVADDTLHLYVMHGNEQTSSIYDFALIRYVVSLTDTSTFGSCELTGDFDIVWEGESGAVETPWFFNASCTRAMRLSTSVAHGLSCDALYDLVFDGTPALTVTTFDDAFFSYSAPPPTGLFFPPSKYELSFNNRIVAVDFVGDTAVFLRATFFSRIRAENPPIDDDDETEDEEAHYSYLGSLSLSLSDRTWTVVDADITQIDADDFFDGYINVLGLLMVDARYGVAVGVQHSYSGSGSVIDEWSINNSFSTRVYGRTLIAESTVRSFDQVRPPDTFVAVIDGLSQRPAWTGTAQTVPLVFTQQPNLPVYDDDPSENMMSPLRALVSSGIWYSSHVSFSTAPQDDYPHTADGHGWRGALLCHEGERFVCAPDLFGGAFNVLSSGDMQNVTGNNDPDQRYFPAWVVRGGF